MPEGYEAPANVPEAEVTKQQYLFRKALQQKILSGIVGNYSQYQKIDKKINQLELDKMDESDKQAIQRINEELDRLKSIHDSRGSARNSNDDFKIAETYFKWERDNVYYKKQYPMSVLMQFDFFRQDALKYTAEMERKEKREASILKK